jgi:hypothetical protein
LESASDLKIAYASQALYRNARSLTFGVIQQHRSIRAGDRKAIHQPRRDLRMLGEWHWSAQYPAERAEWDAGTLYLGCRDCLDASPDHLRIESIVSTGFVGTWVNNQTGIARVVDDKGKTLPNPAGYLCAVRVAGMDH